MYDHRHLNAMLEKYLRKTHLTGPIGLDEKLLIPLGKLYGMVIAVKDIIVMKAKYRQLLLKVSSSA